MPRAKENHVFEFRKGGVAFETRHRVYVDTGDGKEKVNPSYIPTAAEIESRLAGGYRPYLDGKPYKRTKQ